MAPNATTTRADLMTFNLLKTGVDAAEDTSKTGMVPSPQEE
jgi:hypothetical protein